MNLKSYRFMVFLCGYDVTFLNRSWANQWFELIFPDKVKIPRIRMGSEQEIETLISEETFLFAKYLRDEKPTWNPRIVELS